MIEKTVSAADLHVHSRFSKTPSAWMLKKIGCAESYTAPKAIYESAKRKGMDFVTITDHNTIEGCLQIAHLENVFISEEITTYFPDDGCKLHVLAYDITEAQHRDISHLRRNVMELTSYLREQNIIHALAHPLFSVNGSFTAAHFEAAIVLFKLLEWNGARSTAQNCMLEKILHQLNPEWIERIAERTGIAPVDPEPWRKHLIGGSDDHSSLNIAQTYTEVSGAADLKQFMESIDSGKGLVRGKASSPEALAHNLYGIAYQFYRDRYVPDSSIPRDPLVRFTHHVLTGNQPPDPPNILKRIFIMTRTGMNKSFRKRDSTHSPLLRKVRHIIGETPAITELLTAPPGHDECFSGKWFALVKETSNTLTARLGDSILESLSQADLLGAFQTIGTAASLYGLLSPFFLSYGIFSRNDRFCTECGERFRMPGSPEINRRMRVAHFTDTFSDINGVALTLRQHAAQAVADNKAQMIITCGTLSPDPGVKDFQPVGVFDVPEYSSLKLYYPPLLDVLAYCYEEGFTSVHTATPGPVGLAALAVAKILGVPIFGTYHTAVPQYTALLTNDNGMGELMWKYMIWYYGQMDRVYVPSRATGEELCERGIGEDRIRIYPRGIDTDRFHPSRRNGFIANHYGVKDGILKLLYVGRISREKDLPLLADLIRRLSGIRKSVHTIVVGDGPYLPEMKSETAGLPVTYTGFLDKQDLAEVYASSDIFLFPSATDTFGNVVLEAQASGLPVIVTDRGGPCENMIPDRTGYVVPAGDVEAFLESVLKLIDSPSLLSKLRNNARAYMEERSFKAAYQELWSSYAEYESRRNGGGYRQAA